MKKVALVLTVIGELAAVAMAVLSIVEKIGEIRGMRS